MAAKDELGTRGERIAERALTDGGLEVLDRNWRCPHGEIDLVLRDGDTLVIAEVKTRSGLAFGHPFEALTPAKLARLRRLANAWRVAHPEHDGLRRLRIDAVAVLAPRDAPAIVEHLSGVF